MSSTMEPEGLGDNLMSEDELKGLLDRWIAPQPSKSLDQRVANSYHRETASPDSMLASARFPQSHNEVVKMKFCSTCKEEFADKFSFCPVDGTPLNVLVAEPEKRLESSDAQAAAPSEPNDIQNVPPISSPPINPIDPINPTSSIDDGEPVMGGEPVLAGAGSMALVPRGEFHLTMLNDAGLVGRLSKELGDVAHQYQLTWPEFKRDPFGFVKRSLVGYGQMAGKFFGNRNVIAGLIVAVIAMIGLVGIISLLDRAQPGGISRSGFITFAAIALLILAGIFITWLRKSSSGAVLGAPEGESNNAVLGMVVAFSFFLFLIG